MASVTLTESAKLSQDELIVGVIRDIITVDQSFPFIPFYEMSGNALTYNRENVLGDSEVIGVGDTITATAAATFTQVSDTLTTIIGQADVNQLIARTRSNRQDQVQAQIQSKAKSVGRQFRDMFINGTGASNEFTGLVSLCAAAQTVDADPTDASGSNLTFALMDEMLDLVTAKDGEVDFILMHSRTIRAYKALLRGLGGTPASEAVQLANGGVVIGYNGIPIFRNDNIPIDQSIDSGVSDQTTIFAGCWDDGSGLVGLSAVTDDVNTAGLEVEYVGVSQTKDEQIWRVKWYTTLSLFSEKALACVQGINN